MTLGLRLALLVGGLIAALLLALGLYLEHHLGRVAREALDDELAGHAAAIAREIEVERSGELDLEDAREVAGGHDFRIETRAGELVYTSRASWPATRRGLGTADARDARGVRYRVLSRLFTPDHADRARDAPLVLRVAARSTMADSLAGRFRTGLIVALGIGLAAGGLAAFGLTRASLRPLRALAREVSAVETTALDRPIEQARLPRDLRPLATSFNGMLARVDAAFRRQRAFVARASHALRTPTAGMLARAEVALRRDRSDAEYRAALTDITVLAREASATITQMLGIMRAEDTDRPLRRGPLRLAELAAEAQRLFAPRAAAAGLTLRWDVPADAELVADRDAVRELVDALLDNAVRYTPPGGELGLRTRAARDGVELEVWDTGPGIPADERAQVFDRFYRGSAAEHTGAAGSGLGLAICQAIATAHDATIRLADRPGGGTRVVVRFPPARP